MLLGNYLMAKYDYKCNTCGGVQEIEKPMGSDWVPVCCNESMGQVYSAVPVRFNGSGFYSTGG
jgi:predicted nucleic acid-binding Zn ribbon protein